MVVTVLYMHSCGVTKCVRRRQADNNGNWCMVEASKAATATGVTAMSMGMAKIPVYLHV